MQRNILTPDHRDTSACGKRDYEVALKTYKMKFGGIGSNVHYQSESVLYELMKNHEMSTAMAQFRGFLPGFWKLRFTIWKLILKAVIAVL